MFDEAIRPFLSDDAVAVAMGEYSGPTNPPHRNGTYGGVTHHQYRIAVGRELREFLRKHQIQRMSPEEMQEFVNLIKNGRDASGNIDPQISAFNRAITNSSNAGVQSNRTMKEIIADGRK